MSSVENAVAVEGVSKCYGTCEALRDVSFAVPYGATVAVLGPNGAGKTTLVEILEGFRTRDDGYVEVLGRDPGRADRAFREEIGVVLQSCQAEPYLKVVELLELHRGYYRNPAPAELLLAQVGLADSGTSRVRQLSGGQLRRLDLALALVGQPKLVFLDEPTTGFDPQARRDAWTLVKDLQTSGTTIVLTTHYLEEAETLADRVIVIADGRVVADDTPDYLTARRGRRSISFAPIGGIAPGELPVPVTVRDGSWSLETDRPTSVLRELTNWAAARGIELDDLTVAPLRLEDVYLELTR